MSEFYGVMAQFADSDKLVRAAESAHAAGYRKLDAFSPFPNARLSEAIGMKGDNVSLVALLGGLIGGIFGYFMQWYANVVDYPINVAGRPYHSWPSFIVPTFELTILGASVSGAVAMIVMNSLPRLFHPVFLVEEFRERASTDAFFLCVRSDDPKFEHAQVTEFLKTLDCLAISDVPMDEASETSESGEGT